MKEKWKNMKEKYTAFSLNRREYEKYLEEGPVAENLREVFRRQNYELADDAVISQKWTGWWILEGGKKAYQIREGDDKLRVYENQSPTENKTFLKMFLIIGSIVLISGLVSLAYSWAAAEADAVFTARGWGFVGSINSIVGGIVVGISLFLLNKLD